MTQIKWLKKPQKHDYPAAESYLTLVFEPKVAKKLVERLKTVDVREFAAKDIFRASRLSLLGISNSHVEKVRRQILKNEGVSPLLLCRARDQGYLIIADGYHRLCGVYTFDEDAMVPAKIIST